MILITCIEDSTINDQELNIHLKIKIKHFIAIESGIIELNWLMNNAKINK